MGEISVAIILICAGLIYYDIHAHKDNSELIRCNHCDEDYFDINGNGDCSYCGSFNEDLRGEDE